MPVLLLGSRTPAIEAAERHSGAPWVLSETKPRRANRARMAGHALVDFDDADAMLRAANSLFGERLPDAVVATSERAVVPAARLRAALGVAGEPLETAIACHDKHAMKARAREHGILCAASHVIDADTTVEALVEALGLPMVIKPIDSSGSRGTTVARTNSDVEGAMAPGMIAETFVTGVEMSIEGLVAEGQLLLRNPTEYSEPLWASVAPAPLDDRTREAVFDLLGRVVRAFSIQRGIVHMELFLSERGPVFGELALRPPGGHLMDLLSEAYAFDAWEAFLACECGATPDVPASAVRSAGTRILHFGEGTVERVEGLEEARAMAGVLRLQCTLEAGSASKARIGSGIESGHVVATGRDRDEVWAALEAVKNTVRVQMRAT